MPDYSGRSVKRNLGLEWMKLVAIVAIAFQHTAECPQLAPIVMLTNFGVPAFVIVSCWFALDSGAQQKDAWGLATSGTRRFMHLYGLFLLWNSMVLLLRIVNDTFVSKSGSVVFDADKFFLSAYGNALWFLPFIAGANLLCSCTGYLITKSKWVSRGAVIVSIAIGVGLMCWKGFGFLDPPTYFLSVSRKALPSVFLVIGFYGLLFRRPHLMPSRPILVFGSLSFTTLGTLGILFVSRDLFLWETLIGSGVALFAASIPSCGFRYLNPSLSLWIYLAHAPAIQITKDVLRVAGFVWPSGSPVQEILAFVIFIVALALGYWILNFIEPLKRILLLTKYTKVTPQIHPVS